MSIIRDAKNTFRFGNMVNRLILVNVGVFLGILILLLISRASNNGLMYVDAARRLLAMPYNWFDLLIHPYTLLTNIFLHIEPMHLLWNMLALYWFGTIFGDLAGDRRVLPLYLYAGIFGSLVSLGAFYAFPEFLKGSVTLHGASGAVMAMMFASATLSPDYKLNLLLFGRVSIKYVVFVYAIIDLFAMAGDFNAGGHFAHIGGALFGWFFVLMLRRGTDLSAGFNSLVDKLTYRRPQPQQKVRVTYRRQFGAPDNDIQSMSPTERQRRVDEILDKISKSGYDSLTKEEKEILFKASKD